jgi:hypothetical protein
MAYRCARHGASAAETPRKRSEHIDSSAKPSIIGRQSVKKMQEKNLNQNKREAAEKITRISTNP